MEQDFSRPCSFPRNAPTATSQYTTSVMLRLRDTPSIANVFHGSPCGRKIAHDAILRGTELHEFEELSLAPAQCHSAWNKRAKCALSTTHRYWELSQQILDAALPTRFLSV